MLELFVVNRLIGVGIGGKINPRYPAAVQNRLGFNFPNVHRLIVDGRPVSRSDNVNDLIGLVYRINNSIHPNT